MEKSFCSSPSFLLFSLTAEKIALRGMVFLVNIFVYLCPQSSRIVGKNMDLDMQI